MVYSDVLQLSRLILVALLTALPQDTEITTVYRAEHW